MSLRNTDPTQPLSMVEGLALLIERAVGEKWSKPFDDITVTTRPPRDARVRDGSDTSARYAKETLKRTYFAKAMRKKAHAIRKDMKDMEHDVIEYLRSERRKQWSARGPRGTRIVLSMNDRGRPPVTAMPSGINRVQLRRLMQQACADTLQEVHAEHHLRSQFDPTIATRYATDTQFRVLMSRRFRALVKEEAERRRDETDEATPSISTSTQFPDDTDD